MSSPYTSLYEEKPDIDDLPEHSLELPDWLTNEAPRPSARRSTALRLLHDTQFETMFEIIVDKIAQGQQLIDIIRNDFRDIDRAALLRWIYKDPARKDRYYEAQEIGAEMIASEMIAIADASDSIEDVQRSALRISTRKGLLTVWNRKRFGEIKQVELTTVDLNAALEAARSRTNVFDSVAEIIEEKKDE